MHDKPSRNVVEEDAYNDWLVLLRLLGGQDQRPWSVEELIRDRDDRIGTLDALHRLHGAGLIHRTAEDLVFPTRSAIYFDTIASYQ